MAMGWSLVALHHMVIAVERGHQLVAANRLGLD